jgi:hypothetical protein
VPDDISPPPGAARAAAGTKFRISAKTIAELAVNILLPWLVYRELNKPYGEFDALAASAAPPILWSAYELARFRKLDALSLLVLGSIVLSLMALAFGGSPRLLMVRENLFSLPIGAAFLASTFMARPLIYYMARATFARESPDHLALFEQAWRRPHVLRGLRVMSAVWGAGLIFQGALLGWMAWTWPVERYLLVSPVVGYGIIGALAIWTYSYRQALRRGVH